MNAVAVTLVGPKALMRVTRNIVSEIDKELERGVFLVL
jgi:hypothetical protein